MTAILENGGISKICWDGVIPQKTWVNCQIRTADTPEQLAAAAFVGCDGTENTRFENGQTIPAQLLQGKLLQVKLFLGAVNSGLTPRITEIYGE